MHGLKEMVARSHGLRHYFVLALLFVGIETAFEVVIPFLMADIIDVGIMNRDPSVFVNRGFWMLACAAGSLLTGYAYARFAAKASARMAAKLRKMEYEKILDYSFENIDHFESSGLITRMTSDVMVIQNTITNGIRPIARGPMMLLFGTIMCMAINWELSLVFFVAMPVLAFLMVMIVSRVAPQYRIIQKTVDLLNGVVQENLTAIRLVKSFVRDDYENQRFNKINHELSMLNQKTNRYAFLNVPVLQGSMYTVIVVLLTLGCGMIVQKTMEVGELTGILSYVLQIMNSFVMMSNIFLLLTRSMASIQRINEVFDETPAMKEVVNGEVMEDGSVDFDHVSFRYAKDAQENVLEDISLHIPSGSVVGIIGATGSAKTSLVQLICRLYDVSDGELKVGNKKIQQLDLHALRNDVGIVLQNNVLFSGSVKDNLLWGNPDATDAEIDEVCHIAAVDEFIDRLPGGLDMELGQGGVNVSGGQKQRLCIARALLKKPKILIFDDSTSAVDTKTDARIREELASLKGMTQIIISQRVSSISHCDQIVVMENGKIVQTGTHEELLETSPIYQEIYTSQQGGNQNE